MATMSAKLGVSNVSLSAKLGVGSSTISTGELLPVSYSTDANLQSKSKSYTPTETAQSETVSPDTGYDGLSSVSVSVGAISSTYVGSGITSRSSSDLTASGATVSVPSGYYASNASKAVSSGSATTPATTITANPSISVGSDGKITATVSKSQNVTPTVSAGYVSSGTAGAIGVTGSATSQLSTQAGTTISPTESEQTAVASGKYTTGAVKVGAISSTYVGSGITRRSSSDLTASGATVSVPAGYYASSASKAISNGSATASASKGTVSNHQVSVTPTVTRTAGYISAGSANGTAVTVSASELVSGSQTITSNNTYDVTNLASVVVNVSGGGSSSGLTVATATKTLTSAASSIQFTGLSGQPTSFAIVASADIATGTPSRAAAVMYDGTSVHGQTITNTSNAQVSYDGSGFSQSYSNGTLTVSSTGASFQAIEYSLVYTYGGSSANIGTGSVQVGSGATSISFTDLPDEPSYWAVIFTSNFATSSGYQRVIAVANDGSSTYGLAMDSGAHAASSWSGSYSSGTLTISSQGTNAGGYFHQPGYYALVYATGEAVEITTEPLSVTENGTYTAPKGKAYTPVTVNVSGGGSMNVASTTWTNSSNTATSHQWTGLSGTPKFAVMRLTTSINRSSGSTNYFAVEIVWNGTSCVGHSFRRSNGTYANKTTGYSASVSGSSITFSTTGTSTTDPGSFYNGDYQLIYVY